MLVATNTTGQQQLGNTPTLSLNTTTCLSSGSACAKTNTTSSNNATLSPNNLPIMSSSLDVSIPAATATVSPTSNNNSNGNNMKCSNNNNSSSQKYEAPYGGNVTSPCNSDGNSSQNIDDSNCNNKNKAKNSNGGNLAAMDSTSRGERDNLSNISANTLIRQSSASTNSCSVQFNESSPNNGDSSSSSSNASHINNDNNKSNDEDKLNNQTMKNNTIIKEEERDKSNSSSSNTSSSSVNVSANTSLSNQNSISNIKAGLPAAAIVKDEKDLVKKEETSLSPPNMSPVGFGSMVGNQINECGDNQGSTTNKSNDSSSSCDKRMSLQGNVCNENDESSVTQSSSGLIVTGSGSNINLISSCNALNTNTNPLNSKSSLDGFCSDASNTTPLGSNTPNTGGSGINNCMEYMQQQNHIFVFSTQLANKGAEAVLAGQFPTIIAYHCTQPATKSFFEDFFLKNPMKMTKLQRQNTLNIMGGLPPATGPGSGGQPPWLTGNCNTMGKMSHKQTLNKSETITSSSNNSTGSGILNENDMMCWDQTRSVMDSPAGDSTNSMKILESAENSSNAAKSVCSGLSNDDSGGIPSLQGVKVPDENLTPQQRQHREEQLAKLKKMNQFLFPENGGNDFHPQVPGNNPMMGGKMQVPPESLASGMPGNPVALLNMQGSNMGNKLNAAAMRNISGNLMNHLKSGTSNTQLDNMPNLGEDIIMPGDMMSGSGCGPNEMGVIPSPLKQGCMPNINNTNALGGNSGRGLMNASGGNLNMMNSSGSIGIQPGSLMNDQNTTMMGNSSDVLSPFNSNHCPPSGQEGGGGGMMGSHKNMNAPPPHQSEMNTSVGMPQMEWSKLHHHIYEERLKNNHSNANSIPPEIGGGPSGCQQTLTRCNSTGIGGAGSMSNRTNSNASANNRGNQGPPPPYHPTQRSASVPIATQSPNPSSPNNPTSNMSLPSPRASNTMGGALSSTTSPNMDVTSASSASTANTNSTTTTTMAVGGTSAGNGSTNKNTFSQQGSPTPGSGVGNSNRNRSNVNNLNSNPTTPLSHVSPKDIESKNMNTAPTPDHKSTRPNSQRSRSPLINDIPNNSAMEPRFPSPGLNFTPGATSGANSQNIPNSFKNQNSSLEQRQNLQQMPPQFCRRNDNMPLNPNSNRSNQTKMSNSFDPISSLAQMSQQLTGGGVGLNSGGVGNSPNNMSSLMGGPGGVNDINMNGLMGGPMMGGPVDPNMDHCNQNPNGGGGNMGMSGLGGGPGSVPGPFGPGNCNMMGGNPGPICQRLLNPKMCVSGGFNPNQVGGMGMRDVPSGFPGMMPSHRMMNHRMSANFGNFNVSPNIQVKASTPNTIQYMPVRPQNNNNNNNNMRVPPSLEFLQRYANPQMMGNSGGGGGGGPGVGPGASPSDMPAMNGPSDLNKMPNTNNNMGVNSMNQMNFFGNCNQMSGMGGMGQPVGGGDQDELQGGGGMMGNHDPMNIPHAPMLRGMRPMRQGGLQSSVGMNSGSRMQHPGMGNIPPNGIGNNPFPGSDNESLDCNDPSNGMFNNAAAGLYQQKNNKPPPMGMSHGPPNLNPNNGNNGPLPNSNVINDQNPSSNPMQNSVMMGPNNSMLNSNIPNSNNGPGGPLSGSGSMGYKPFVGPTSNDLKYAQQYHSFQQQLYATSTRNQQPGGGQQQPPNAMSPNSNPNAGFFVNK
ncbi:Protein BCL9 like protein [Lucilia cuprina]|nr:Protein BCL9 like protein [Lucilia cuprina]